MHSRSIALTTTPPAPMWFGWRVLFRCETCFATCPRKNKDNHAEHDIVPATYAMSRWEVARHVENLRESVETRHQKNSIAAIIAMSIPSSANEDCHEDRGPKQLDPCDYCRRQPWEGGPGGIPCISPGPKTIYVCIYVCLIEY